MRLRPLLRDRNVPDEGGGDGGGEHREERAEVAAVHLYAEELERRPLPRPFAVAAVVERAKESRMCSAARAVSAVGFKWCCLSRERDCCWVRASKALICHDKLDRAHLQERIISTNAPQYTEKG